MVDIRDCLVLLMVVGLPCRAYHDIPTCPFAQLEPNAVAPSPQIESAVILANTDAAIQSSRNYDNNHSTLSTEVYPETSIQSWLQNYFRANDGNAVPTREIAQPASELIHNFFSSKKLQCAVPPKMCSNNTSNFYYRSLDGSCNNLQHSGFGMANSRFSRLLPPTYSDGIYQPTKSGTGRSLPNARLLSLSMFGDKTVSDSYRTLANMQWGQFVAHDISRIANQDVPKDCCTNLNHKMCYPIMLQSQDPISYNGQRNCLNFGRTTADDDINCPKSGLQYSEKISQETGYLDISPVYGSSIEANRKIREGTGGLLKTTTLNNRYWLPISMNKNGECGEDKYQCYSIPDKRNQMFPGIAVLHTLMHREHNRICKLLAHINPHYSDEKLFQEARKINIAQYQKITYYDWLPLTIGLPYAHANNLIHLSYNDAYVYDYDQSVNTAPYAEFASAAFRYLHNQIPGSYSMVAPNGIGNQTFRLSDSFGRPETVDMMAHKDNFDALIRGLATQRQKRADSNIDREIKHFFNRKAFEQFGSDLKAIDIQRGRDFGLASYNDVRQYCGLPRACDWSEFLPEISADKIELMRELYESPDDVDLNVGASQESQIPGTLLGPTFRCVIGKQFLKTRTGDRFFFEREDNYSGFSPEQLREIRKASLAAIFCNNADYLQHIQSNVFIAPNIRNILISCDNIPQIDLSKWSSV